MCLKCRICLKLKYFIIGIVSKYGVHPVNRTRKKIMKFSPAPSSRAGIFMRQYALRGKPMVS